MPRSSSSLRLRASGWHVRRGCRISTTALCATPRLLPSRPPSAARGRRPFPSPYLTGPLSRRNHGSSASIVEIDASGMSLPTGVPEHGGAFSETSTLRSPCNSATYKPGMLADTISRILPSQRSSNSLLPARHTDISFSSQAPSSAQPVESLHQLWKEEITTAIFPGLGSL